MSLRADYREQADRMRSDSPGPASRVLFAQRDQLRLPGFGTLRERVRVVQLELPQPAEDGGQGENHADVL